MSVFKASKNSKRGFEDLIRKSLKVELIRDEKGNIIGRKERNEKQINAEYNLRYK